MIKLVARSTRSVASKIFGGFIAMAMLIATLGYYAFASIGSAGDVVEDTFDRPLMAINFARSASQKFSALEIKVLSQQSSGDGSSGFEALANDFEQDLQIARERSISSKADDFFNLVQEDFKAWKQRGLNPERTSADPAYDADLAFKIKDNLDIIVELQTNESFRNREHAIATMDRIRALSGAAFGIALLLAIGLTFWIVMTILRPLKAAANAAREISSGNLDTNIPEGKDDETGQLLRTIKSMRDNIRLRMEKEQNMRCLLYTSPSPRD